MQIVIRIPEWGMPKPITIPKGYIRAYTELWKYEDVVCCLWFVYPFVMAIRFARKIKYALYRQLNIIGVMHTPEGHIMTLSDLWR